MVTCHIKTGGGGGGVGGFRYDRLTKLLKFVDIANLEKPDLAPEFYEISNLSKRTSSEKKIGEAGGISFSRLSRWGLLRRKITS